MGECSFPELVYMSFCQRGVEGAGAGAVDVLGYLRVGVWGLWRVDVRFTRTKPSAFGHGVCVRVGGVCTLSIECQ